MEININELNVSKEILIDENFGFNTYDLKKVGIKRIENIKFIGKLYYNVADEICLDGTVKGLIYIYDSVDLSDYELNIDMKIEEILENCEKVLDIESILWENIVLEVPIRATNTEIGDISGNGWKIKNDEEESIDPRLEKLQELFKGGE